MKEQRLIDANAIKQKVKNSTAIRSVKAGMLVFVDCAPTIDLETLPIVRELREQLAKVAAERDAAIANLKQAKSGCDFCRYAHGFSCDLEEPCIMHECWEWRRIQEVQEDE